MNTLNSSTTWRRVVAAFALALLCSTKAFGAGVQIEKVMRDFQVRYRLVSNAFLQWPKCSAGITPAPQFPKDSFYGNLNEDPNQGVLLVKDLVQKFYTDNKIYESFVKAANGYNDLENVTSIDNYTSTEIPTIDATSVTTNNYIEKLQAVASDVAKLKLISVNATPIIESDSERHTTSQGAGASCETVQGCIVANHASTQWGSV